MKIAVGRYFPADRQIMTHILRQQNYKERGPGCSKTKCWYAGIVGRNSYLLWENRNFLRQGVFRMSPEGARNAERREKPFMEMAPKEKCLTQYVPSAEKRQKYLSSRDWGNPSIAVSVFQIVIRNKTGSSM